MVEVINISAEFEPILGFLYPDYALVDNMNQFGRFITRFDVTTKMERERLNYKYENCVIISSQIFDEVWDAEVIKARVLEAGRKWFGSRKRVLNTQKSEGSGFIQECIYFLFTGKTFEVDSEGVLKLFDSYGSRTFLRDYLVACEEQGVSRVSCSMETFLSKMLSETDSVYFKKVKMRLGSAGLENHVLEALRDFDGIDPFLRRHYKDLCNLRLYTKLIDTAI